MPFYKGEEVKIVRAGTKNTRITLGSGEVITVPNGELTDAAIPEAPTPSSETPAPTLETPEVSAAPILDQPAEVPADPVVQQPLIEAPISPEEIKPVDTPQNPIQSLVEVAAQIPAIPPGTDHVIVNLVPEPAPNPGKPSELHLETTPPKHAKEPDLNSVRRIHRRLLLEKPPKNAPSPRGPFPTRPRKR